MRVDTKQIARPGVTAPILWLLEMSGALAIAMDRGGWSRQEGRDTVSELFPMKREARARTYFKQSTGDRQ